MGVLVAGGVLAVVTQWREWGQSPGLAVLNGLATTAFLLTGALLRGHRGQRANGSLFALCGVAWAGVCLGSWRMGPLPMIGLLCRPVFVLACATVLLRYPAGRLPQRSQRVFVSMAAAWLGLVYLSWIFSGGVGAFGYSERSWWPPAVLGLPGALMRHIDFVGAAVIGTLFCGLVAARVRRVRGLERMELVPVMVAGAAAGLAFGLIRIGMLFLDGDRAVVALRSVHSAAVLAIPAAFAVAAVRRQLDRAVVADVVVGLSGASTVEGVQMRLRRALRDPALEVLYWVSEEEGYVDASGRRVDLPPSSDVAVSERLSVPVRDSDGERLALVLADPALRRHGRLVTAAVSAVALALENARLQAGIRAQLEQIRAAGARILEVGLAERRRLERDLHDGAQQRLLALTMQLGALRRSAADERTRQLVDAARADLRSAMQELRDLARGLHPAVLSDAGLRPALESVAQRLPIPVRLDVPDGRWDAAAESAAYFFVCEALTNVVKHAGATHARVVVRDGGDRLCVEVTDDGAGGAEPGLGGGLAGLRDRIRVLGGDLTVLSPPGAGTRISAGIPSGAAVSCG